MIERGNEIYKEIESFRDYELTQCIAYEMAIRNDEVKKLLNILKDKKLPDDFLYDNTAYDDKVIIETSNSLKKYGFLPSSINYYFSNPKKISFGCDIRYKLDGQNIAADFKNVKVTSIKKDNNIFNKVSKSDYIEKNITTTLSRPQLYFKNSKIATIDINFSLPKKELLAYIEKIKDNFDKDFSMIKTRSELLEEEIQKADNLGSRIKSIPTKQQKMADMFFIYDYVTDKMKEAKEYNERYKAECDEKLSWIINDNTLSIKEKNIQKLEARRDYCEAKSEATIKTICSEDEVCNQVGLKIDSVYGYYLAIKPYIEEGRYKKLITGVSIL